MSTHDHKDLLSTLAGKVGENLATAYLKWLLGRKSLGQTLLRALTVGTNIIAGDDSGAVDDLGKIRSVELESFTTLECDEGAECGRLDMLIETDRWVIGIESKFFAEFQSGQPVKYLQSIRRRANIEGRRSWLVILAPEKRLKNVKNNMNHLHSGKFDSVICTLVSWESLFTNRINLSDIEENELNILEEFYRRCCDPFNLFRSLSEKNKIFRDTKTWSDIGNVEMQGAFLRALATFADIVPSLKDGRINRSEKTYIVYEFPFLAPEERQFALFGFVDRAVYGLRGIGSDAAARAFVMCVPKHLAQKARSPGDRLKLQRCFPKPGGRNIHGIIRHAEEDGEVWMPMEGAFEPGNEELWLERVNWVFGESGAVAMSEAARPIGATPDAQVSCSRS